MCVCERQKEHVLLEGYFISVGLVVGQTLHSSRKFNVKMRNDYACRDCGPFLQIILQQYKEIIHIK